MMKRFNLGFYLYVNIDQRTYKQKLNLTCFENEPHWLLSTFKLPEEVYSCALFKLCWPSAYVYWSKFTCEEKPKLNLFIITSNQVSSENFSCCHQKDLNLCSEDEQKSYGFGTTWGWVLNDRILILGWTNPLTYCLYLCWESVWVSVSQFVNAYFLPVLINSNWCTIIYFFFIFSPSSEK